MSPISFLRFNWIQTFPQINFTTWSDAEYISIFFGICIPSPLVCSISLHILNRHNCFISQGYILKALHGNIGPMENFQVSASGTICKAIFWNYSWNLVAWRLSPQAARQGFEAMRKLMNSIQNPEIFSPSLDEQILLHWMIECFGSDWLQVWVSLIKARA